MKKQINFGLFLIFLFIVWLFVDTFYKQDVQVKTPYEFIKVDKTIYKFNRQTGTTYKFSLEVAGWVEIQDTDFVITVDHEKRQRAKKTWEEYEQKAKNKPKQGIIDFSSCITPNKKDLIAITVKQKQKE